MGNKDIDKVIKLMKTFKEIVIGRNIIDFYTIFKSIETSQIIHFPVE